MTPPNVRRHLGSRRQRAELQRRRREDWHSNPSDCPWAMGYGYCVYGCREEPSCMTDCPQSGWPSKVQPLLKCELYPVPTLRELSRAF